MIEREFYRLRDLAERWGCTVDDLLHLGIQDRAQICVNVYGMATGMHKSLIEAEAPEDATDNEPLTNDEDREDEIRDGAYERWKARVTREMPHGVFELHIDDLRFIDMPNAFPHELHEALKFDGSWWECKFDPPVSIDLDHLCLMHEEVERLDSELFGRPTDAATAEKPLGTTERNTLLRIIAALAHGGYGIVPTAHRIDKLGEIKRDADKLGISISDDTLRKKLREAFAMIENGRTPHSGDSQELPGKQSQD